MSAHIQLMSAPQTPMDTEKDIKKGHADTRTRPFSENKILKCTFSENKKKVMSECPQKHLIPYYHWARRADIGRTLPLQPPRMGGHCGHLRLKCPLMV
jgi:hypothetical protein